MRQRSAAMGACLVLLLASKALSVEAPVDAAAPASARFQIDFKPANVGGIGKIDGETITVRRASEEDSGGIDGDLAPGVYFALVSSNLNDPAAELKLLRAKVTEYADGTAKLEQTRGAARRLKLGQRLAFFAIRGATEEQLADAPELVTLRVDDSQAAPPADEPAGPRQQATNNVRTIVLCLHDFHDGYGRLPPAVVHGPDGRPWHSWRVLVLPFIEEVETYKQYRFDEPWDGPNNSKLLDKMPALYRDPAYGDDEGHDTHFAAITGDGMAFTAEGSRFDGTAAGIVRARSAGRRLVDFVNADGASLTLMIGPVSPERAIPWTKPEDIVVGEDFPGFDPERGFAAPHAEGDTRYGVFGFADGAVQLLPSDLEPDVLRKALTFNGGEPYDHDDLGYLDSTQSVRPATMLVEYSEQDGETIATVRQGEDE